MNMHLRRRWREGTMSADLKGKWGEVCGSTVHFPRISRRVSYISFRQLLGDPRTAATVATPLVPLHVASHTERLSTTRMLAFERLFASVRMAVDP